MARPRFDRLPAALAVVATLLFPSAGCVFVGASDNDDGGSAGPPASGAGAAGSSSGGGGATGGSTAGASGGTGGVASGAGGVASGAGGVASGAGGVSGGGGAGAGGAGGVSGGGGAGAGGASAGSSGGGSSGAGGGPTGSGETCADPILVASLPFTTTGDTTGHTNDAGFDAGVCPGVDAKKGNGSPDRVYAFTAPSAGTYFVKLVPKALYDTLLYVTTSCTITKATCLAASDELTIVPQGLGTETVTVTLSAGQTVYVFVDGWSNVTGVKDAAGAFELTISPP